MLDLPEVTSNVKSANAVTLLLAATLAGSAAQAVTPAPLPLDPIADVVKHDGRLSPVTSGDNFTAKLRTRILMQKARFSPRAIDSVCSSKLGEASVGLEINGQLDAATWAALDSDSAPVLVMAKFTVGGVAGPSRPPPAAAAPVGPLHSAVAGLLIPVVGVKPCDLLDTFSQAKGAGRTHDAIDIMAARGTPVVAASDGHVVKLFTSKPGGLTVYEFDPLDKVVYYYAHLDRYAPGLVEGQLLQRGDLIGFVGSSGDASANAPHLHFEVQLLGPEKQWWHATSINPYGRFEGQ